MKTTKNSIIKDISLLIDFSCEDASFELFHKMLIRMSYKAVDVNIAYDRKRIYMNVLTEDESYDSEPVNAFAEKMKVNLGYTDLRTFLKARIVEDNDRLKEYYPFLMSSFSKTSTKTSQVFEKA